MLIDVPMPKMGESIMEGTVIKWYKNAGDFVKKDETLFEISTDKVDTEVPSLAEGILSKILVSVNETVEVGKVVAVIDTSVSSEKTSKTEETQAPVYTENKDGEGNVKGGEITEVVMPKMGESIMEGTVIKWHKNPGETVKAEETLFEISTDKVDTEVPSPVAGKLIDILVKEQETVAIGTVVARISPSGDRISNSGTGLVVPSQTIEELSMNNMAAGNITHATTVEIPAPKVSKEDKKSSKFLSPLVISIANAEKIPADELENVQGTGIDGRVTKKDVLQYIELRSTGALSKTTRHVKKSISTQNTPGYDTPAGKIERIPMDIVRTKIMQHTVNSRDTSVHVTGVVEVDMTKIYNFIKANKESFQKNEGVRITYMPFIVTGVVNALKEFPYVNASIEENSILVKKYYNIGIAVAVEPNGLIVPNIKSADEKNLIGISKSIRDLADRARTKKLTVEDITGGTFTITNYGVFGSLFGTPIINQPEVAILGVGTVVKRPVVVETDGFDSIAIKPMMYLSLSHDHRLVDGMLGGRFLKSIKDFLESFTA